METRPPTIDAPNGRIHIVHVVRTGFAGGGMENGIINVANRLPTDQYKISICALDKAETFSQRIQRRSSEYYLLPPARSGVDSTLVWRLARVLRRSNADVVHSHNWGTFLYAILAAKLARVRVIHGEHGKNPTEFGRESRRKRWTKSLLGPRVDRLVTVSRALAAEWNDYGVPARKILNIPNGVDVERFCPRPVNGQERRTFGLPPDGFIFGSIGRFDSLKNYEFLIASFERVASLLPASHLVLLGDGPCKDRLKRKIDELKLNNLVYLIGRRSDPENFLRALDVFVLPSKYEGMSNVVLEAMATGLAVVCADLPSHREVFEADREGVVVSPLTVDKLAKALVSLAYNRERCRALGLAAREKVVRRFSLDRMVLDYEQLYASFCVPIGT
jgi:sugar transferase (PEP-CTERM/EpsH1 system associated)